MIELKDLLLRFQNLIISEETKKKVVAEAISAILGVEVSTQNMQIKNGTVILNIKPIYKNEIFRKKEEILEKINSSLGKNSPKDIR